MHRRRSWAITPISNRKVIHDLMATEVKRLIVVEGLASKWAHMRKMLLLGSWGEEQGRKPDGSFCRNDLFAKRSTTLLHTQGDYVRQIQLLGYHDSFRRFAICFYEVWGLTD